MKKNPHRPALKALDSDLYKIQGREARKRAAEKVLEELGYIVHLERGRAPPRYLNQPRLKIVDEEDNDSRGSD